MPREIPMFSRSGQSDPDGKLVARIDVPVPESVREDAAFVARASRMTLSEWARKVLVRELYGSVRHIETLVHGADDRDGKKM